MNSKRDFFTMYGAGVLAMMIETYWRARGYDAIRVERYELPTAPGLYGIRSNVGPSGFPPRHVAEVPA